METVVFNVQAVKFTVVLMDVIVLMVLSGMDLNASQYQALVAVLSLIQYSSITFAIVHQALIKLIILVYVKAS